MLATVAHEKSHLVIGDMSAGQRNGPLQREGRSITQPPLPPEQRLFRTRAAAGIPQVGLSPPFVIPAAADCHPDCRWPVIQIVARDFGGVPLRGIYDNMKTAVTTVFVGKERVFNRRFLVMADHYMVEPTACSPAAGWEKGQVENQVQTIRGRFFQPRLKFASIEELNGWLEAECLRWAAMHSHPEQKDMTVAQALEAERPGLQPMLAPFDGFHETSHAVTGTCLISFDRNRYSVAARAVRRAVQVRAYADRIVVRLGDEVVAEHPRCFGRDRTLYNPWHYLPVLVHKPGALRNGAPFGVPVPLSPKVAVEKNL